MSLEPTELVLGRGEVHFNAFVPGTKTGYGERYLGNTTSFQLGRQTASVDRYTSYGGKRVEQAGEVIGDSQTVHFTTDNISMENVGHWYGGVEDQLVQAPSAGFVTETLPAAPGRTLQLGQSIQPFGVRGLDSVSVSNGGNPVPRSGNYTVDARTGRITILPNADAIEFGDLLTVSFQWRAAEIKQVQSQARHIYGALRFISKNAYGPNKNYFFPYVRLSARGQVDLKGDQWQQMVFDVAVMRLSPYSEQVYIEEIANISYTADEFAIINFSGIGLDEFPYWENELDIVVNTTIPTHHE